MIDKTKLQQDLAGFTGSETFTKWSPLFRNDVLTEGTRYLAENAGAYWLMDAIASHQHDPEVRAEPFQVWVLELDSDSAWLWCEDGNDDIVAEQAIAHTDFPLSSIKLYAVRNELGGITIMLPSEY